MIQRHSLDWSAFVHSLTAISTKSNREVLCVPCWRILNYDQKMRHLKAYPSHACGILTSKAFATEAQILSLATREQRLHSTLQGEFLEDLFLQHPSLYKAPDGRSLTSLNYF